MKRLLFFTPKSAARILFVTVKCVDFTNSDIIFFFLRVLLLYKYYLSLFLITLYNESVDSIDGLNITAKQTSIFASRG